jgi:anti-sigma factor RsiW
MTDELLDLLYRSFDGELDRAEQCRLDQALAQSEMLREERDRILTIRESLSAGAAESFRPFFAERVINRLMAEAGEKSGAETFPESLSYVFRRVAFVGAAAVIGLAIFNIARSDTVSPTAALGVPEITIEEVMETPFESVMEALS